MDLRERTPSTLSDYAEALDRLVQCAWRECQHNPDPERRNRFSSIYDSIACARDAVRRHAAQEHIGLLVAEIRRRGFDVCLEFPGILVITDGTPISLWVAVLGDLADNWTVDVYASVEAYAQGSPVVSLPSPIKSEVCDAGLIGAWAESAILLWAHGYEPLVEQEVE